MLQLDKIYHASIVLKDAIRVTDIIYAPQLREGAEVYLKTENLQVTGSFKVRGAYYKISQLTDEEKARGVVACSAGNHAQGVALAAAHHGIKAKIFLPEGAPISKVEATKGYGAEVVLVKGVYDDAYQKAMEVASEENATFIHPFDDECVIAGQGTIGLEILSQIADVDVVIVPIGGGGLISGVAFAIKSLRPEVKIYGVQAEGAPSMAMSISRECIEQLAEVKTIADGIAVKRVGEVTFDMCRQYVDGIVTVNDDEISSAILALIERHKMIAEGAGAVAVAAAMFGKLPIEGKKVCCIVSGGNIDVTILSRVIKRGLLMSGRNYAMSIELPDKPGQLTQISKIISDMGANVIAVNHERSNEGSDVTGCYLRLEIETRNYEHIDEIREGLIQHGFKLS